MTSDLERMQAILDEAQLKGLGGNPTSDQISAYFNAAVNSACGAVQKRYGDGPLSDSLITMFLQMWMNVVGGRAGEKTH